MATRILKKAKAENLITTRVTAAHPGGTAKIGDVVNSDLKTKFDNLYICDCSVMPEPWGVPPIATILCLGKRLGKHLFSQ